MWRPESRATVTGIESCSGFQKMEDSRDFSQTSYVLVNSRKLFARSVLVSRINKPLHAEKMVFLPSCKVVCSVSLILVKIAKTV